MVLVPESQSNFIEFNLLKMVSVLQNVNDWSSLLNKQEKLSSSFESDFYPEKIKTLSRKRFSLTGKLVSLFICYVYIFYFTFFVNIKQQRLNTKL